jgi:hypothetical protein
MDFMQLFGYNPLSVFFGRATPEPFALWADGDDGEVGFSLLLDAAPHEPAFFRPDGSGLAGQNRSLLFTSRFIQLTDIICNFIILCVFRQALFCGGMAGCQDRRSYDNYLKLLTNILVSNHFLTLYCFLKAQKTLSLQDLKLISASSFPALVYLRLDLDRIFVQKSARRDLVDNGQNWGFLDKV